ncbi:Uncharacterised protein [Mycobacterium tuberculosis]|uniref:Uncharacterized protein n=2 Tax=Mycobacterium tuberculosis TaxID=1773 RepID=A0A0T9ERH6_MYCTX|nr:Uncharacterised protein [Mycobacterium tuberculosis]CKT34911.1 Uncharacterised protein [Mycobacterium tuberculosis]CKT36103.1 Uncharacterised protein [Mycobacterium tuberculosis]CKT47828.1 Uncharacterised protein [Mycobacterium tuberculosis]CNV58582.1 Uncharacterised protein [Mycobacterium tuberculosis]
MYWRFFTIGARYCTHNLAACSPPSREAAWIAPHRKAIGLAMLLPASAPVSAPLAGSKMLLKFCNTVGLICSVCLMSSRLSTSAVVIDASLSDAVPIASRCSAAKLPTSATTALRSSAA